MMIAVTVPVRHVRAQPDRQVIQWHESARQTLRHGDEQSRKETVRILAHRKGPFVRHLLVYTLRYDPSLQIRIEAWMALVPRFKRCDVSQLRSIHKYELDPGLKRLILAQIRRLDCPRRCRQPARKPAIPVKQKTSSWVGFFSWEAGLNLGLLFPYPTGFSELRLGFRSQWFEFAFGLGVPLIPLPTYSLSLHFGMYSLRKHKLRLRHSVALGVMSMGPVPIFPYTRVFPCDVGIRISRSWWFEVTPAAVSLQTLFMPQFSAGVRFRAEW